MRMIRRIGVALLATTAVYVLLLVFPQPLFAYELDHAGIVVHATAPIPAEMRTTLDRARERLDRSPLRDKTYGVHVFVCQPRWLFALFVRTNYRVAGVADVNLGDRVFLRESDMAHDRLIGPSGQAAGADRPLSYFVAHEIMHIAHGRLLGGWRYHELPQWVDDGDADYVARPIDFSAALRGYHDGVRELDPARSGLYVRYALMVAYLVEKAHVDPIALLTAPPDRASVERALRDRAVW